MGPKIPHRLCPLRRLQDRLPLLAKCKGSVLSGKEPNPVPESFKEKGCGKRGKEKEQPKRARKVVVDIGQREIAHDGIMSRKEVGNVTTTSGIRDGGKGGRECL